MSNDITKMYQFINNNYGIDKFMKDADYNGDNVIIKSEFENFLNSQGYSATKDVIDSFWKSVDANDSEKRIEGTNLKNYRAVTKDEADRIEKIVEYYDDLKDFCKYKLTAPTNLSAKQQILWLSDMEAQLKDYYNAFVAGEIDKYDLTDKYEELVISITPRHAVEETMRELINGSELSGQKYDWEIDWNGSLGRKMASYIKNFIKNNSKATSNEIVEAAHKLVNSMLDNAAITGDYNSTKVSLDEGFTQNSFTELQQVILDNILISHTDVQALLAGETPTVIDKLFKRFYNGYFHQELKDFVEQQAGVVKAFKLWFAEYGADILAEIKAYVITITLFPRKCLNLQSEILISCYIRTIGMCAVKKLIRLFTVYLPTVCLNRRLICSRCRLICKINNKVIVHCFFRYLQSKPGTLA